MLKIYSLQCQVVDANEEAVTEKVVKIYLNNKPIVKRKTDDKGHIIDNSLKEEHINKKKEEYKVEVIGFSSCETIPDHILQEKDAQKTKDSAGNDVITFALKITVGEKNAC